MKASVEAIIPHKIDATIEGINNTWFVRRPVKKGSVWKYMVTGVDTKGEFDVARRYNDFIALRLAFVQRWPGCYIPYLPDKQGFSPIDFHGTANVTNWNVSLKSGDDEEFIELRRALFERFIREIAKYKHLTGSEEFMIFSRGGDDLDKKLRYYMDRHEPDQVLAKYRTFFKIDER